MSNELVKASTASVPKVSGGPGLPVLVERAGGAARFAWEEFFYAEHHNTHTQRAYERAVRRFVIWCEGQGVELASITPGMVGQYLVGLGGSPAKRNQHLAALRGFFDRLVNRHVCILNPASSVRGVKDEVTGKAMSSKRICELVKRRVKDAGLYDRRQKQVTRNILERISI